MQNKELTPVLQPRWQGARVTAPGRSTVRFTFPKPFPSLIQELAPTRALFAHPQHPYTQALLSAVPVPDPDISINIKLTGEVADPGNLPPGCSFHPRCPLAFDRCRQESPVLREIEPGRWASCHALQS